MSNDETKKLAGTVKAVSITGVGQGSAQLVFVVENPTEQIALTVRSFPAHEPQIFGAIANLVTAAYWNERTIGVEYLPSRDLGGVADVVQVYLPADVS